VVKLRWPSNVLIFLVFGALDYEAGVGARRRPRSESWQASQGSVLPTCTTASNSANDSEFQIMQPKCRRLRGDERGQGLRLHVARRM